MNLNESQIREDILLSARRMVAGLEVAKREQQDLARHIKALDKYGEHGAMSRMARDAGRIKAVIQRSTKRTKEGWGDGGAEDSEGKDMSTDTTRCAACNCEPPWHYSECPWLKPKMGTASPSAMEIAAAERRVVGGAVKNAS